MKNKKMATTGLVSLGVSTNNGETFKSEVIQDSDSAAIDSGEDRDIWTLEEIKDGVLIFRNPYAYNQIEMQQQPDHGDFFKIGGKYKIEW